MHQVLTALMHGKGSMDRSLYFPSLSLSPSFLSRSEALPCNLHPPHTVAKVQGDGVLLLQGTSWTYAGVAPLQDRAPHLLTCGEKRGCVGPLPIKPHGTESSLPPGSPQSVLTQLGGLKVSGVPQRFSWTDNGKDCLHRLVLVPRYPRDKVSFRV